MYNHLLRSKFTSFSDKQHVLRLSSFIGHKCARRLIIDTLEGNSFRMSPSRVGVYRFFVQVASADQLLARKLFDDDAPQCVIVRSGYYTNMPCVRARRLLNNKGRKKEEGFRQPYIFIMYVQVGSGPSRFTKLFHILHSFNLDIPTEKSAHGCLSASLLYLGPLSI